MIKRIAKDFFVFGFSAHGVIWAITRPLMAFFPDLVIGGFYYTIMVAVSVIYGLWRCWPRNHVELSIPASDSSIEITFGDIFEGDGITVIPVNEYFDGLLDDRHVSENSLHGKFIRDVLGGQSQSFYNLISPGLESIPAKHVAREKGREKQYPIGTVARADTSDSKFLLVALSRTDTETLKASATIHDLWDCLTGIWQGVRVYASGNSVKIPLFGSGLSGVGLPPKNLIELITTSFLDHTKKQKIADKITMVLPSRLRGKIDLVAIKRSWTSGI